MTKQPDPSRSSTPRHGSALPSSIDHPSPKLETITPVVRREGSKKPAPRLPKARPKQRPSASDALDKPLQPKKRWKPVPDPIDEFTSSTSHQERDPLRSFIESASQFETTESFTIRDRLEKNRHPLSAFLTSLTVHVGIFLILALAAFAIRQPNPNISIVATIDSTPIASEPADVETIPVEIDIPNEEESPLDMSFDETSNASEIDAANSEFVAPSMVTNDSQPVPAETDTTPTITGIIPTGGGLEGRTGDMRAALAARMGGTRESEEAVELGLKWIIKHQRKDGSWRFFHDDGRCNGQCLHQGEQEAATAATGLALMALMGAGYTHEVGKYQDEIKKGLDYLVEEMKISKHGGSLASGDTQMYAHAIATIALSEALTMTNDTNLAGPVDLARKYIESVQHKKGGWRYSPGRPGDLSVTGWQLMALKSCEISGFPTGPVTYKLAEDFVDSMAAPSQGYGYLQPGEQPTMTAVGVLSKMYLGAEFTKGTQEQSTRFLADHGPSKNDMYFNFYATQVLHHRHDDAWPDWNEKQRNYLIRTQDASGTHSAGSWYFPDHHGKVGGRLYTTAMAVMILEVYYRYLPLYEEQAVKTHKAVDAQDVKTK